MAKLILLVGESGSGKDYAAFRVKQILSMYDEHVNIVQSNTTREPRYEGESTHTFLQRSDYAKDKTGGRVIADTLFHGNLYWTNKDNFDCSKNTIYIIDKEGVENFKNILDFDEVQVLYLKVSKIKRVLNMIKRGDTVKTIYERLNYDEKAFEGIEVLVGSESVFTSTESLTGYLLKELGGK